MVNEVKPVFTAVAHICNEKELSKTIMSCFQQYVDFWLTAYRTRQMSTLYILLCLTPDDFTRHGESSSRSGVKGLMTDRPLQQFTLAKDRQDSSM